MELHRSYDTLLIMDNPKIATIKELRESFSPIKNINIIHHNQLTTLDKLALFVTEKIGSMGFFFFILAFNLSWIAWNTWAPKDLVFDPAFSFLILLFINNILQILFMPLIMVGQNLQGRHAELRAGHEYQVNIKAEKEVETILLHLENQQQSISKILEKIDNLSRK